MDELHHVHTASSEGSVDLQHPAPGLEALQGAYLSNVERLEESAERLSTTSSGIGEELRRIREEQKRTDARASYHHQQRHLTEDDLPLPAPPHRQFSESSATNSIISTNHVARNGGYSPGGACMTSPQSSMVSASNSRGRWGRSVSQSSRPARVPLTGIRNHQPESSTQNSNQPITSPLPHVESGSTVVEAENIPSHQHQSDALPHQEGASIGQPSQAVLSDRPQTPASCHSHQIPGLFSDFDGIHYSPGEVPSLTSPSDQQSPEASMHSQSGRESRERLRSLQARQQSGEVLTTDQMRLSSLEVPTSRPMLTANRPQSHAGPGPGMVFYPAPVPMILNLPKRISKIPPPSTRDRRATRIADVEGRRTTQWLPDIGNGGELIGRPEGQAQATNPIARESLGPRRGTRDLAGLPPQLRASVFFDRPAARQEVRVLDNSPVATLDSILDASAHAPVDAFTDHPIMGKLGAAGIYTRERPRQSAALSSERNPDTKRRSSFGLFLGDKSKRSTSLTLQSLRHRLSRTSRLDMHQPLSNDDPHSSAAQVDLTNRSSDSTCPHLDDKHDATNEVHAEDPAYYSADEDHHSETNPAAPVNTVPTTLLAELQLRKVQLRNRNRTAATDYPNGMHSTLLELDRVAEVQKETRRQKHIALAWQDPSAAGHAHADEQDDDDIPLAILYPGGKQTKRLNDTIPLGLMEKREIEDNEPLSLRRDRLRGGYPIAHPTHQVAQVVPPKRSYQLEVPGLTDNAPSGSEDEEETLAQRSKRLKAEREKQRFGTEGIKSISGDFASELLSQFGGELDTKTAGLVEDEPEGETLGQRRKRLKAAKAARGEGEKTVRPGMKQRSSMADLLHHHPAVGARPGYYPAGYQPQLQYGYGSGAMYQPPPAPPQYAQPGYGSHMPMGVQMQYPMYGQMHGPMPNQAPPVAYGKNHLMGSYAPEAYGGYNNMGMRVSKELPPQMPMLNMVNPHLAPQLAMASPYGVGFHPPHGQQTIDAQRVQQMELELDPRRRELIDRWRQSILPDHG